MSSQSKIVRGRLDDKKMAADFGVDVRQILPTFGLKTDFQKQVDSATLEELRKIKSYDYDYLDQIYYSAKLLAHFEERLRAHTSSIEAFANERHALGSKTGLTREDDSHYSKLVVTLESEILSDPARRPQTFDRILEVRRLVSSTGGAAIFQILADTYIAEEVENTKDAQTKRLMQLLEFATNSELRDLIITAVRGNIKDLSSALAAALKYSRAEHKVLPNPFVQNVTFELTRSLEDAKTAHEKARLVLNGASEILPFDWYLDYKHQVFQAYLAEGDLNSAKTLLEQDFHRKARSGAVEDYSDRKSVWKVEYAAVYDHIHIPIAEAEDSLEKLRDMRKNLEWNSKTKKVIGAKIGQILDTEIAQAQDIATLSGLLDWPEAEDEQKAAIRLKKRQLIEEQFVLTKKLSDYLGLWKLLDNVEREEWASRFYQIVAHFYLSEDNIVEVEVPAAV